VQEVKKVEAAENKFPFRNIFQRLRPVKWTWLFLLAAGLVVFCAGCAAKRQEPVTVTLWHVYGGETESPLNDLIEVFNSTEGREKNIRVQVGSVATTNTIHENVLSSAYQEPGAMDLPDMFISYPKTVLAMPDETVLVDYRDYFSTEELEEFIPDFLEEGMVNGRLAVLPVAKSTEILYINQTAFDRFAAATGAQVSDLETWEGLFGLADDYLAWTDAQTPDIPGDGKVFFVHDYHFNYFQVGVESLGEDFFDGNALAFGPMFEKAWEPYARAALTGGVWLQSGYATEPLRTGDSIVSVASSASVLYYSDTVTYSDNTTEKVNIVALPSPVFAGGEKLVMQRGAGICTVKSTPEREQACITFLKWLTEPERNVEFVTRLGYMPVKQESFEKYLPAAIETLEDPMYASLYQAFLETQKNYTFYTPPKLDTYLNLETRFEELVRLKLTAGRALYLEEGPEALDSLIWSTLSSFKESYIQ
jgi:multiple sugar transport system substrate-binding protein